MQAVSANMQNTDWDIFRYVIAVADSGSAVAAAEKLGVNGSTVLRRISRFEEERGVRLFDRLQSGYTPTLECEAIIRIARDIQENVFEIDRNITGRDLRLEGRLSVTTTDTFIDIALSNIFAEFCASHPGINLDITVTSNRLNLTSQDADIAIRASKSPPEHLIGQRVSGLSFSVYGLASGARNLEKVTNVEELKFHSWVGIGGAISGSPVKAWMETNIPQGSIKMTADSFTALRCCIAGGCGLAVLPSCLGDSDTRLRRMLPPIKEMETSLWVLTHPDVHKSAKIKALTGHVSKHLREQASLFEGT